jgi:UDP-glucose 6-dehydrogenase
MSSILIIGMGNVGKATARSLGGNVTFHDPPQGIINNNFNTYEHIFICVDTLQNGPQDYSDLDVVLLDISGYSGTVVLRSTVTPDKVIDIESNNNFNLIIFPEFMDHHDFKSQSMEHSRIVLGGDVDSCKDLLSVLYDNGYSWLKGDLIVSSVEASIIKLSANAALATKLITFNVIHDICQRYDADYDLVRRGVSDDDRIGYGHTLVPSPDDSQLGFGGHCLPKDIIAIAEIDNFNFFKKVREVNRLLGR